MNDRLFKQKKAKYHSHLILTAHYIEAKPKSALSHCLVIHKLIHSTHILHPLLYGHYDTLSLLLTQYNSNL